MCEVVLNEGIKIHDQIFKEKEVTFRMEKCKYCNADVNEGESFCPNCGKSIDYEKTIDQKIDGTAKVFAALSYLNIGGFPIFLIPFFVKRKDSFVWFHTIQGILLYVITLIETILAAILRTLVPSVTYAPKAVTDDPFKFGYSTIMEPTYSPGGLVIHWVFLIIEIVLFVLMIIGIVNAIQGKRKKIVGKK